MGSNFLHGDPYLLSLSFPPNYYSPPLFSSLLLQLHSGHFLHSGWWSFFLLFGNLTNAGCASSTHPLPPVDRGNMSFPFFLFFLIASVSAIINIHPSNNSQNLPWVQSTFRLQGTGPLNGQTVVPLTQSLIRLTDNQLQVRSASPQLVSVRLLIIRLVDLPRRRQSHYSLARGFAELDNLSNCLHPV